MGGVDKIMQKTAFLHELESPTKEERDVQVLAKLGKKSVLKVIPEMPFP